MDVSSLLLLRRKKRLNELELVGSSSHMEIVVHFDFIQHFILPVFCSKIRIVVLIS